jgi:RNA polymerase-binding transcription factor DksA
MIHRLNMRRGLMTDYGDIKQELTEKLNQLVARAEKIDADLSETPDEDWEERATEQENDEVLASVGNATLAEIEEIKHALHQIETGTYGTCSACGAVIAKERLEVLPTATSCMRCA